MAENLPEKSQQTAPTGKSNITARVLSWVQKAGPFLISLSDVASDQFAKHKGKVAAQEALAQVFLEEHKAALRVKEEILKRLPDAAETGRAEIRMRLGEVDKHLRTVEILAKAVPEIARLEEIAGSAEADTRELSDHWMDHFIHLSSSKNEPWRKDLLARALAIETSKPGTIRAKDLWSIGTLSEQEFHALAHMLDVSTYFVDGPMVPNLPGNFMNTPIEKCQLHDCPHYGNICVVLLEANLIHPVTDVGGPIKNFDEFEKSVVQYCGRSYEVEFPAGFSVRGLHFTALGGTLARLYIPTPNEVGTGIFEAFISTLKAKGISVVPVQL